MRILEHRCCHMGGLHAERARMGILSWFNSRNLDSICIVRVTSRAVGLRVRLALRGRAAVRLAETVCDRSVPQYMTSTPLVLAPKAEQLFVYR